MTDTVHLGLPVIEAAQAQKHVTHNEALAVLDTLVMLAVIDRDRTSPPASPAEGDRYLVKAPGAGGFAGRDHQVAHYLDGSWSFRAPATGWTCYVEDEATLVAWDGSAWLAVVGSGGGGGGGGDPITELQDLLRLGLGTTADATNPLAARLNNALWTAKPVAEGGDGSLRYKLSKESADKTLSFLFQNDFSGRAEIGLTGDNDFHFKVSPDGSAWADALIIDRASAAAKFAAGIYLTGVISPPQITSDQNDYAPAGFAGGSLLRLSSDASRNVTGLAGGAAGRTVFVHNVGSHNIVLKDDSASSAAANRFALTADLTLAADALALLQYDGASSRWRAVSGGGGGSGSSSAVVQETIPGGRLTLASGVPVMTSTVAATGTLYYTPDVHNVIWLYNGAAWIRRTFAEISIALSGGTASKVHDVFAYDNAGVVALELVAWTNDTTRATALTRQDGVLVKSGDATRRYLGSVYLNGSKQAQWTYGSSAAGGGAAQFDIWNSYNRRAYSTVLRDSTATWTYATAAYRASNNSVGNRVTLLFGLADEDEVMASFTQPVQNAGSAIAIGLDSPSTPSAANSVPGYLSVSGDTLQAFFGGHVGQGRHYLQLLERAPGTSSTFYGANGALISDMGFVARFRA